MTEITITIDDTGLPRRSDGYLALAWHASQANPAAHADKDAGQFAEHVLDDLGDPGRTKRPAELRST